MNQLQNKQRTLNRLRLAFAALLLGGGAAAASMSVEINPSLFDFGWAPDNAQISADFFIKNTGTEIVPLNSVQPTCGCTASQFTPGNLPANDESKIGLTFNTRGYNGVKFSKSTKVKYGNPESEYSVILTGHVTNPDAKVVPVGSGIAAFEPGSKEKKQTIALTNKSSEKLSLETVQKPAEWATVKLANKTIEPNQTVNVEIGAEEPFDLVRNTSVTFEAKGSSDTHRVTLAIRTGAAPVVRKPFAPAPPSSQVKEKPSESVPPLQKKGEKN